MYLFKVEFNTMGVLLAGGSFTNSSKIRLTVENKQSTHHITWNDAHLCLLFQQIFDYYMCLY